MTLWGIARMHGNNVRCEEIMGREIYPTDCLDGALSTLDWLDIEGVRCSLGGKERD